MNPDDPRPRALLNKSNFLPHFWALRKQLPGPLTVDGIEREPEKYRSPSLAVYGSTLVGFHIIAPEMATEMLDKWIHSALEPETGLWRPITDYYAQNWIWFGLAAYHAQQQQPSSISNRSNVSTLQALQTLINQQH